MIMKRDLLRSHRSAYLLPNVFTTGNLFAGLFAILQSIHGRFEVAAIALVVAMFFDAMDGRVARLTKTQSSFGEQYDSMSDMVSFGIAPAILIYQYALHDLGRWGMVAVFIYVACAGIRLARFNANIKVVDSRYFQGLPSPSAAAMVAGFVWLAVDNKIPHYSFNAIIAAILTIYAGLTMISNAPFLSGKKFPTQHHYPAQLWLLLTIVIIALIWVNPPIVLSLLFLCYALSGWVILYFRWQKIRKRRKMVV